MEWLTQLLTGPPTVASAILIYAIVIAVGRGIGSIRIGSFELGPAGAMFIGLIFGHFGLHVNDEVSEFVRDFGLILFVFAIGLSIGPGFLNAIRSQGLTLNLLATTLVLLSLLMTIAISAFLGVRLPIAVGIFSGATTNTPSLAIASELLRDEPPPADQILDSLDQAIPNSAKQWRAKGELGAEDEKLLMAEAARLPSLGYAVCYPCGILGSLITIWLIRVLFRVDPAAEAEMLRLKSVSQLPPVAKMAVRVTNSNLQGIAIADIPGMESLAVTVSRHRRGGEVDVARPETILALGDHLLVVGEGPDIDDFRMIVGEKTETSFEDKLHDVQTQRLVVSSKKVVGSTIADLRPATRFGVQVTRILRSGIELPAAGPTSLQLGDQIVVVGSESAIKLFADVVGDAPRNLWHPDLIPIFVGIAFGVLLGSMPITLPIINVTVRLGLAGGVLVVALIVSNLHRIGPLVWFLKPSAGFLMREMGIALFLSSVGLRSGDRFVETLVQGDGLLWMGLDSLSPSFPCWSSA